MERIVLSTETGSSPGPVGMAVVAAAVVAAVAVAGVVAFAAFAA
jgi:hypothetical protein